MIDCAEVVKDANYTGRSNESKMKKRKVNHGAIVSFLGDYQDIGSNFRAELED